jgi:gliding motility-associated-like protein
VSAGNDTAVILGEQLGISAFITDTAFSYPVSYKWSPSKFIDKVDSPNITITGLPPAPASIKYRVTATTKQGCTDTSYLTVKFFNTKPDIFVPSAFSPNGDGHNDLLIPMPVGIARFQYFKVYNRYGQIVYSTTQVNEGWDGTVNGTISNTGTFVYVASGIDYLHNPVFKKGTVVLIR